MNQNYKEILKKILLRKAKGYGYKEKVDEYVVVDGVKQLSKTKVTTKRVQPDTAAVKALLELETDEQDVTSMTDEQLQVEKLRLIKLLKVCDDNAQRADDNEDDL